MSMADLVPCFCDTCSGRLASRRTVARHFQRHINPPNICLEHDDLDDTIEDHLDAENGLDEAESLDS